MQFDEVTEILLQTAALGAILKFTVFSDRQICLNTFSHVELFFINFVIAFLDLTFFFASRQLRYLIKYFSYFKLNIMHG